MFKGKEGRGGCVGGAGGFGPGGEDGTVGNVGKGRDEQEDLLLEKSSIRYMLLQDFFFTFDLFYSY
jgi:hypothetical protein